LPLDYAVHVSSSLTVESIAVTRMTVGSTRLFPRAA
jgi:hypothetical protein